MWWLFLGHRRLGCSDTGRTLTTTEDFCAVVLPLSPLLWNLLLSAVAFATASLPVPRHVPFLLGARWLRAEEAQAAWGSL